MTARSFILLFCVATISPKVQAADLVRVLIPIQVGTIRGANGSLWESVLTIYNDGNEPVRVFPTGGCIPFSDACLAPIDFEIRPHDTVRPSLNLDIPNQRPIQFLYVDRKDIANLHFRLAIREAAVARHALSFELPVIRETEIRSGRVELLDVPLRGNFRVALRIFDFDARAPATFDVRIYPTSRASTPLLEAAVATSWGRSHTDLQLSPGEIQLRSLFDAPELANVDHVRVEIEPKAGSERFFAYITVTDNETLQVVTITPQ